VHTVAFIPVRGGSKSIPGKNIKPLAGKPLIYWTAKAASDCPEIDVVYVCTDDSRIRQVVEALGLPKVQVVGRSPETATDTASTESALLEFAQSVPCERIVLIQATSPLLEAKDLSQAIAKFETSNCDSLLSTVNQKRFIWSTNADGFAVPLNYAPSHRPRRQDFNGYEVENGAFYIMTRAGLLASSCRLHGKMANYSMAPDTFVELDEPGDWKLVEGLLRFRYVDERDWVRRLSRIKAVITDVDGVLTDAGMYYTETGDELKKFNTRDGKGFELLRNAGMKVGIITSEDTKIVERRARKLKCDFLYQGAKEKGPALTDILAISNLSEDEIAYIGDDLADVPILKKVGFSAAPADATKECLETVDYVCLKGGGEGCFRELAELILNSRANAN